MAVRTTSTAVSGIIEVDSSISVTPFIEVASSMVDRHCATALDSDGNAYYSAAELELIERWLSAHFYAVRDIRPASESAGKGAAQESKQYKVDLGLQVTIYGQQALRLDSAGGLAALEARSKRGTRRTASLSYLGVDPDDATPANP